MSIFPRRLRPGGTVTVHYSVAPTVSASEAPSLLRASIVDPRGRERSLIHRFVWLPPGFSDLRVRDIERHLPPRRARRRPPGLARSTPLLLLGDLLGGSRDVFAALMRFTGGLHCYASYRVPAAAPLGRYQVRFSGHADGQASGPDEGDYFLVEDLRVAKTEGRRGRHVAFVRNRSPEPVPAHLVDLVASPRGRPRHRARTIELAAGTVSEIPLRSRTAFLFYSEYREVLALDGGRGAFVARNPVLQWKEGRRSIHVTAAGRADATELDGPARHIWLMANGFFRRNDVRTQANRRIYDEMLREKLILELQPPA